MKLQIISDLHVDFCSYEHQAAPDADVLVIAGDVCEGLSSHALPWIAAECKRRDLEVIFVPGNHEFYGCNMPTELVRAAHVSRELGIHLLPAGEAVVLGNTRFTGATVWTDYALTGHRALAMSDAGDRQSGMTDHRRIRHNGRFTPRLAAEAHRGQRNAIDRALAERHDGPTVVVTHHAPSRRSLPERELEAIDAAYASNLEELICRHQPALWIHGHIHRSNDYSLGPTRVISNPRGYVHPGDATPDPSPENPSFDPQMQILV